jgi:hypothetical protein
MTKFNIFVFASACLFLSGCSGYVLKASSGYMKAPCSFDQMSNAVRVTASREGAKDIKEEASGNSVGMQHGKYTFTTAEAFIVEISYLQKQGEAMRVLVSVDPESKVKMSSITEDLFDNLRVYYPSGNAE